MSVPNTSKANNGNKTAENCKSLITKVSNIYNYTDYIWNHCDISKTNRLAKKHKSEVYFKMAIKWELLSTRAEALMQAAILWEDMPHLVYSPIDKVTIYSLIE